MALRIDAVDDFVADALSKNAPRPPNMEVIVALNRGPFPEALPPSPRRDVRGATVLDVRDAEESAAGHLPGALNVPLSGGSFATKSAFVLGDGPVVVHARSDTQAQDAARRSAPSACWSSRGSSSTCPAARNDSNLSTSTSSSCSRQDAGVVLLDVREADERDEGYIAGSRHIPYRLLPAVSDGLADRTVITICSTGARAGIAASVLAAGRRETRAQRRRRRLQHRGGRTIEFRRCGS